jgi:hypothetical protein
MPDLVFNLTSYTSFLVLLFQRVLNPCQNLALSESPTGNYPVGNVD